MRPLDFNLRNINMNKKEWSTRTVNYSKLINKSLNNYKKNSYPALSNKTKI